LITLKKLIINFLGGIFVGVTTVKRHLLLECLTDREPSVCHSVGTATY